MAAAAGWRDSQVEACFFGGDWAPPIEQTREPTFLKWNLTFLGTFNGRVYKNLKTLVILN